MQRVTPYVHEARHQVEPPQVVTEWLILLIEIHRLASSVLNIREDNSGSLVVDCRCGVRFQAHRFRLVRGEERKQDEGETDGNLGNVG
jgi:hypothetical protein